MGAVSEEVVYSYQPQAAGEVDATALREMAQADALGRAVEEGA